MIDLILTLIHNRKSDCSPINILSYSQLWSENEKALESSP